MLMNKNNAPLIGGGIISNLASKGAFVIVARIIVW